MNSSTRVGRCSARAGGIFILGLAVLTIGMLTARAAGADPPFDPDENAIWFEKSIPELQELMASGQLTSRELTMAYLRRIERLNPTLGAVIETNPTAIGNAAQLDAERRNGHVRGPLHGMPILLKDNIATDDAMQTTAGSLALVGTRVPEDATLVANLRAAGAVILGKTNLSEWANFRGFVPPDFPFETNYLNGWSARGGFTHNPYLLGFDPCGSSSGSGVAPAANLCAAAVGTETDGSISCPAGNNMVVGLKPTIGLVSQSGVIPISHSQDSAGPMARTVTDVALLLNVMKSPFGPVIGQPLPDDYTDFLDPNGLAGARIGVDRRYFQPEYFAVPEIAAAVDAAIAAMDAAGAVIVDPVDTGDPFAYANDEMTVLLYEFKGDIASYLAGLDLGPRHTRMRTLGDLIAFNNAHCDEEMEFFGQEIFEWSESLSGDLSDPEYVNARSNCLELSGAQGIDRVMAEHDLDAIITPSYTWGSTAPANAGYPILSVPIGMATNGMPVGAWLYAGFLSEPQLLRIAYAMEQLFQPRLEPEYPGAVPPDPPNAGLCLAGSPRVGGPIAMRPVTPMHLTLSRRLELEKTSDESLQLATRIVGDAPAKVTLDTPGALGASTRFRFGLPRSERVNLAIYNIRGERVATLVDGQALAAGRHELDWDGRAADGRTIASGVYFCRLLSESATLTRRVLIVR